MSKCFVIPDSLLKRLGDKVSILISNRIRARRNRVRRFLSGLFKKELVQPATLSLVHDCRNGTTLPGDFVQAGTRLESFESQTARDSSKIIDLFYDNVLNRNSIDDNNMNLVSSVHYDKNYNNAFWNGEQMVYGDGDGKFFTALCGDLSVCGHEISHGVIERTAGLVYFFEPGAANESYADKLGIAIEQWFKKESDPKTANWLLGDDIIGSEFPGKALRSFKDEKAYDGDPQPKHNKDKYRGLQDNGGVHINSGILNHAFYLYSVGLNEPSYGKPIQIAYKALQTLGKFSNFRAVKKAEIKAAKELYGEAAAKVVEQAYAQVGL